MIGDDQLCGWVSQMGFMSTLGTFHAPEDYKKELKIYFKNI